MAYWSNCFAEPGKQPVVIFARWEIEKPKSTQLWLFSNRPKAEEFAKTLPKVEQEDFEKSLALLDRSSECETEHMKGAVAGSLVHVLGEFAQNPASFLIGSPAVCVVWDPIPNAPNEAVLIWVTPQNEFQVAIIHSQAQGKALLKSLEWIDQETRARVLKRIAKWPVKSIAPMRTISGPAAYVLGTVAVVSKERFNARRNAN